MLIDYPGFNWWVARAAKRESIPVYYDGAPQMWAWAPWRVHKMRRLVNHVLCKLPFEEDWFRSRGCQATHVGHPYFDEMASQVLDVDFLRSQNRDASPLVTILPGSRTQEVTSNLRQFFKAARHVHQACPSARFAVAAFNERQAQIIRGVADQFEFPIQVHVGRTPELIHLAHCCMACSGSVSLELLFHEKPTVILYAISPIAFAAQRVMKQCKYITLVNLLASGNPFPRDLSTFDPDAPDAEKVPYPEYLTFRDVSQRIAAHLVNWLENPDERGAKLAQLRGLKQRYAHPGATQSAARFLTNAFVAERSSCAKAA